MKKIVLSVCTFMLMIVLSVYVCAASFSLAGDLDGDFSVDINDAILLLQHSMFPDDYELNYNGSVDFTNDGSVDINDAILLLQYSMFPEHYPIVSTPEEATEDAYTLVYNKGISGSKEGINSGWVLDNRGGPARTSNSGYGALGDVSEKYATAYIREFNLIESGRIVTELLLTSTAEGAFVEFRDEDEKSTYKIKIVDGYWSLLEPDGDYEALSEASGKTLFRIVTDLNKRSCETFINGRNRGKASLLSDNILSLRVGIDEEGTGSLSISEINAVVNYSMYESFDLFGVDSAYSWNTEGDVYVENKELYVMPDASVRKLFSGIQGNVTLETYFNTADGGDFRIKFGDALEIENSGLELVADGQALYSLTPDMWYRLRVDADTKNGDAKIWLNGRVIGEAELSMNVPISYLDVFSDAYLMLDNMKVYGTVEHVDYCPEPENKANLDDYIVAVNVCSLWRNGTHYGWACITPYDEPRPVIGYYDEGVPEAADWEIKYMVEHGIDVQSFCWFGDVSNGPIKTPNWGQQLHDGYMYARYSEYMKYNIQWETSATKAFDSKQFRNYVIPFWFENYFLDDRYFTIDNKIVLSIYNAERLATNNYFGSNEAVAEEFDYLKEVAKEYGFSGVIILVSGIPSAQFEKIGVDGTFAYNWGEDGRKLSENKSKNIHAANSSDIVHAIPTVSVGFDSVPWHHLRHGLISAKDFKSALEWVRDEHLPSLDNKPSWADNLVWLSTWNEYGEGTYIFPSGQNGNGFGYVDGIRSTFTDLSGKHTDAVPTQKQLMRITHLYPQYARLLRREGWYRYNSDITTSANEPKNKLYINDVDILSNTGESFHIPPVIKNGKVYFPFNPSTAVNYILGCHYEWRKEQGTLRILANDREVVFTVGSESYSVDGISKPLGYKLEALDGIPMLDFALLANDLDYDFEEKDGNLYIYTDTYEHVWVPYHNRKTGTWEFNDYDSEGWDGNHFDITVGGGSMIMVTNGTTNDPYSYYSASSFPKDFYTKRYTDLEIRVRYNYQSSRKKSISFFYTTDIDSAWNEDKSIKFNMPSINSGENWIVFRKSLAEIAPWQTAGRITGLRLDPFDCQGTFEIDYIRFIEDPDFVYVPPEEKEFSIENGDAENPDSMPFYSSNATISIVDDPENEGNNVYLVEAYSGNTYTYFRHAAEYELGATYKIDFDIRLAGNNADNPEITSSLGFCCNFRYLDKEASGGIEHTITTVPISMSDGWVHYSASFTVERLDSNDGAEFTIYVNPKNGVGFDFMVDNVSVVKQ